MVNIYIQEKDTKYIANVKVEKKIGFTEAIAIEEVLKDIAEKIVQKSFKNTLIIKLKKSENE